MENEEFTMKLLEDFRILRIKKENTEYRFSVTSDDKNCRWEILDNENGTLFYVPFGYEVARIFNIFFAMNPDSELHQKIINCGFDNSRLLEDFKKYENEYNYLKAFIKSASNFSIQERYTVWCAYRYMAVFPDLWYKCKITSFSGIGNNRYFMEMLSEYVKRFTKQDKRLYIGSSKEQPYMADTYYFNEYPFLFEFDLYKVLISGSCGVFHTCQRCGFVYFDNDKKTKYCPECKKNKRKIINEKRKSNKARYLHKRVQDKLNQFGKDTSDFTKESNYYWAVCQGKNPSTRKLKNYLNISEEKEYIEWLEKQLY